ncbi:uroporphyrinogen-III synthase [Sporobacter termitidis DSM 10068]|uniref:uroporphyrinogen-III C-methyltransferase n=1 Tax=Sporobacter termitidis DSM 10068 TaxID=1123282 RepID=A0A1M5XJ83_9FIRM|nr:uroporphyrinogen-III C-methyltransferase [Sporobacter termitidis]SHH99897.1 uroporphyrinogen-III synthase [Sporobacter termitidis DSM 10068]
MKQGKVWLVGAGPSDPGLLTLKARSVLEEAEVVLYDSLAGDGVLALIPPGARRINVGKRAGHAQMPQEEINKTLLEEARQGNRVVRLKGGDPFLFGRGGEELELLRAHGVPFEIVPGVTSAIAVPAYAGIPVTHRDFCSSVHIITGHLKDDDKPHIDFEALTRLDGTLIFLMGVGALGVICRSLMDAGMSPDTPAAVLEKGTTADQRRVVSTLKALPADAERQSIATPAIIVVGRVCALAEKFHWAEDRPLGGARVIVTRPRSLASGLSKKLYALGAEVVEIPAIQTVGIENNNELQAAIKRLNEYQWLVFTSQAGVDVFFDILRRNRTDIRCLAGLKFAAIGTATEKAIADRGIFVDCMPATYDAASLGRALAEAVKPGEKLLIPRARIGSPDLTAALDRQGISYDDIPVYDTVYESGGVPPLDEMLKTRRIDYVAFTSASTVRGFASMAGAADFEKLTAVCIGEQTAREAKKLGMKTEVSDEVTIDSLTAKIAALHQAAKA